MEQKQPQKTIFKQSEQSPVKSENEIDEEENNQPQKTIFKQSEQSPVKSENEIEEEENNPELQVKLEE